jgi:drug/metabolite transporter (DMT)-like permease
MGPLWMSSFRFLLAGLITLPIAAAFPTLRAEITLKNFLMIFLPGLFLSLTLVLQTWGLRYTSATKSGFITTLYVALVPVVEWLFFSKRMTWLQAFSVVVALAGMALIAGPQDFSNINIGDLLTLGCAMAAACHIISVGHYAHRMKSALLFNTFQSLWAGILPLGLAIALEVFPSSDIGFKPLAGFLYLAILSTVLAFMLQIRAQKFLSPALASMIFLLESPFAAVYAYLLLGERLDWVQWIGAGIIMFAVTLSSIEETRKHRAALPHYA